MILKNRTGEVLKGQRRLKEQKGKYLSPKKGFEIHFSFLDKKDRYQNGGKDFSPVKGFEVQNSF